MTLKTKFGHGLMGKFWPKVYPSLQGENGQNRPENHQNRNMAKIALKSDKFMKYLNYKSSLKTLIWPLEEPFFVVRKRSLLPEVPTFETKKLALRGAKSKF